MRSLRHRSLALVILLLFLGSLLWVVPDASAPPPVTLSDLSPSQDTWIVQNLSDTNGASVFLNVQSAPDVDTDEHTLIQWDLSAIPSTATIVSATMTLRQFSLDFQSKTLCTYPNLGSWTDASSWLTAPAWDTSIFSCIEQPSEDPGTLAFPIETVAQSWVSGDNFGLRMKFTIDDDTDEPVSGFASSENATAADRPTLDVTYSTDTFTLFLAPSFIGASRRNPLGISHGFDSTALNVSYDMESLNGTDVLADLAEVPDDLPGASGIDDVAGVFGRAREFIKGDSDFIVATEPTSLGALGDTDRTVVLRMRMTDIDSTWQTTFALGNALSGQLWDISVSTSNFWTIRGFGPQPGLPTSTTADTDWHTHIVTHLDAGDAEEWYLDCELIGSVSSGRATGDGITLGRRGTESSQYASVIIDEALVFKRVLTSDERGSICADYSYPFRFESAAIIPDSVENGTNWIRGANLTWGAQNYSAGNNFTEIAFTTNASVWFDGVAISWDSLSNVSDADIGFNFTWPTDGQIPYWVNDTLQGNLTSVGGAFDFNWTDWTDGEHFFELGFAITSTPILTGTVGSSYSYDANTTKTNVTWSIVSGPAFLVIDPSTGILLGLPLAQRVVVVTIRASSSGLTVDQTFILTISAAFGALTDVETMIIWLFLILMLVLFVLGPVFRMFFLWMLGGIIGVLFGLLSFDLLANFELSIVIMGLGGFLMVGGILLTISQAVRGAIAGREV